MKCWKCEGEALDGTAECAKCGDGLTFSSGDPTAHSFELDWSKVESVGDLRQILADLKLQVFVDESNPHFKKWQRWLKPRQA